jgi:hypothetical protein
LEIKVSAMAKRPSTSTPKADPAGSEQPKPKRARSSKKREPTDHPVAIPLAEPSADDIRRRAYQRFQERGGDHGQHFDDWLEAEKELKPKK